MSNSLEPDQCRQFFEPDLGPNCLQKSSAVTLLGKDLIILYIFQFYEKENIRGVVSLNEEWELEDFSNSEEVCFIFSAS